MRWLCVPYHVSPRRGLIFAVLLGVATLLYFIIVLDTTSSIQESWGLQRSPPPEVTFECPITPVFPLKSAGDWAGWSVSAAGGINDDGRNDLIGESSSILANVHVSSAQLRLDARVLVFVETPYSKLGRLITETLEAARIRYRSEVSTRTLPTLTNLDRGRFAVIVFENIDRYLVLHKWNRELLDKYAREYSVGIIGFVRPSGDPRPRAIPSLNLVAYANVSVASRPSLNPLSPVLRMCRAGEHEGDFPGEWTLFTSNHSTFTPVMQVRSPTHTQPMSAIVQDEGLHDGVRRVIFGTGFNAFWLVKLIFLDSISYLSHGKLSPPLERHLLIDIDDIFVSERGTRMQISDVEQLRAAQARIRQMVPGFRFNLGFSGRHFHRGYPAENRGEDLLLSYANEFWWFCHMFGHTQAHLFENETVLENEMRLNREFALQHGLGADQHYSVAPHHSGVYPVHEPLYDAWKRVWDVRVTSTEEYPHLRPARFRRGFIHRGIMVLPRQTCGLYTHTNFYARYPGGSDKLEASIHGGELFYQLVLNTINVFMTHFSNYANDRLALYTFETAIRFVKCWTNIHFSTIPPLQLGEKYFTMYPDETTPLWGNPCDDPRHRLIWSRNKSCAQLPHLLVIGPQKTGTTALYSFLKEHPAIESNENSAQHFEEVQFFNNDKNYLKGIDWYRSFFSISNDSQLLLFEKSATYFDSEAAPKRVHALLPKAKLVAILTNPAKRAYSWYQHQRAHGDPAAVDHSFLEVISANDTSPKALRDLQNRCLQPGLYAVHLQRWLNFFPNSQLFIIDGEELRHKPVEVMNKLEHFLQVTPYVDYQYHLEFDPRKGFFCPKVNGRRRCLGASKGRRYPDMCTQCAAALKEFYLHYNVQLSKLLGQLKIVAPNWLREELTKG
ncbi:bifunctional heparan sulfate N-deacetylase/N-sulfotransferase-like isoform X1 [Varroa destructor]|uniref:[heparan sulfate]-glucosamine N-sulfotransferase n=1 Tax=Varroa destructor TaxID=109461 RepID=A0A7M7KXP4_VARDE|nr:bifunctional heparan sulfate N-deacetylase/N-sulfotransferase-like isoform X1 [Varroa destructor]